jgi:hypothetical protein
MMEKAIAPPVEKSGRSVAHGPDHLVTLKTWVKVASVLSGAVSKFHILYMQLPAFPVQRGRLRNLCYGKYVASIMPPLFINSTYLAGSEEHMLLAESWALDRKNHYSMSQNAVKRTWHGSCLFSVCD